MTFLEMLLSLSVVAGVLGGMVVASDGVRARHAERQTLGTLRTLRVALLQYRAEHGVFPAGPTSACLGSLLAMPGAGGVLRGLPMGRAEDGGPAVLDGYGRAIEYIPPGEGQVQQPDFVSAGPDGRFGDLHAGRGRGSPAAVDNLYGSDTEAATP
jgi:hypothetical protein